MRSALVVGSVAFKLLRLFADHGHMPGFTVGDLTTGIEAPVGTACYQRMKCDLIGKGWQILRYKDDSHTHRYWMPPEERERAKRYIAELVADAQVLKGQVAA